MVGLSEDSVTNHIEIEVRAKMQQQAKAQREQAKQDAVLAREREIQADRSEAFMAPFNDGSLSHMATYSSGSSWTETVGGETWRDHAKVLLQLYEEGRFVFKVRHWSEDDSGLESFEHENAWYSGNFGRTGEGSVLRMSVVGCAKNVDAASGVAEGVAGTYLAVRWRVVDWWWGRCGARCAVAGRDVGACWRGRALSLTLCT